MDCEGFVFPEVKIVEPRVFADERGYFMETYHEQRYRENGIERTFVQDNRSHSVHGVVRGLHYQLKNPQAKLVFAVRGEIFDVVVDIRHGSPNFGKWMGVVLSDENHRQLFVPEGFAHGFTVLSEAADVAYKCSDVYTPGDEYGILWEDEMLGIDWHIKKEEAIVSDKDRLHPALKNAPKENLPVYEK